jgi:hypothetical protein
MQQQCAAYPSKRGYTALVASYSRSVAQKVGSKKEIKCQMMMMVVGSRHGSTVCIKFIAHNTVLPDSIIHVRMGT